MGKPVVMGRKTFESIFARLGKPLPGRTNIVVSRTGVDVEGAVNCPDIDSAMEKARAIARRDNQDEIIIFGGAQIYDQTLSITDRIYLTEVHETVAGDAFFPPLEGNWREVSFERHDAVAGEHPAYSYILLERI